MSQVHRILPVPVALTVAVFSALPFPGQGAFAANQTATLSPIVIGASQPFGITLQTPTTFNDALPTLQSFARAQANGQWLLIGGIAQGSHIGGTGFVPAYQNTDAWVVDPTTQQVWHRSLQSDPTSGLAQGVVDSLSSANTQFSQIGSHLYITGGYGEPAGASQYATYDTLTSIDVPGLMNWVKNDSGTAAGDIGQIHDPMFQVTGGEMGTTDNGLTHLIFGQNYSTSYTGQVNGIYTNQVRTFRIVDNAGGLSVTDIALGATNPDFRRRDLTVAPIIQKVNGQLTGEYQALAGVFTPSFGGWTVPVIIGPDGTATEPDPTAANTFKQGMNSYRTANIGLYSKSTGAMHTLLLGGITYEYFDPITQSVKSDPNLPYSNDSTDIVTDAQGNMTQYLLPPLFPQMTDNSGKPLYFGAETEFFLADGVPTFDNGVIDLDALTGPTLVGYLFGGIISNAPNGGKTVASNLLFPVMITPGAVPEPGSLILLAAGPGAMLLAQRRKRS